MPCTLHSSFHLTSSVAFDSSDFSGLLCPTHPCCCKVRFFFFYFYSFLSFNSISNSFKSILGLFLLVFSNPSLLPQDPFFQYEIGGYCGGTSEREESGSMGVATNFRNHHTENMKSEQMFRIQLLNFHIHSRCLRILFSLKDTPEMEISRVGKSFSRRVYKELESSRLRAEERKNTRRDLADKKIKKGIEGARNKNKRNKQQDRSDNFERGLKGMNFLVLKNWLGLEMRIKLRNIEWLWNDLGGVEIRLGFLIKEADPLHAESNDFTTTKIIKQLLLYLELLRKVHAMYVHSSSLVRKGAENNINLIYNSPVTFRVRHSYTLKTTHVVVHYTMQHDWCKMIPLWPHLIILSHQQTVSKLVNIPLLLQEYTAKKTCSTACS
ncbi:hypothetical protein VP01_1682g1 [Puccinia sorghi]|uniref:Uncharacterized protein n=1 Tax=Puccinia sorghi TaxID=27349 RepID=A0A0L6VFY9_9BASI|nr:hypothetical protein VP01_1682g1 [Puccinia sorghi]